MPIPHIEYEAMRIVNQLLKRTKESLLIQTRKIDNIFFKSLLSHSWHMLENDLRSKNFDSGHIQILINKDEYRYNNLKESLKDFLKKYISDSLYYTETYNSFTFHILFDSNDTLTLDKLNYYIKSLPKYVKVEVNLRNILE